MNNIKERKVIMETVMMEGKNAEKLGKYLSARNR
jgi:hypothetical protein